MRDQIRKDVLNNFESVRVWLFDPPSDSTAVLKTKLTIGKCSPLFKSQVQTLRKVLSSQLLAPTLFGGQVMTARTLMALVSLVVGALNKGETVLPQSTYVSMMNTEMRQVRDRLCESMDEACEESLASLNINFTGEKAAVREFEGIIDGLISEYNSEARETVGELAGDLW